MSPLLELIEALRGDVAEIAVHINDFVVTQEGEKITAGAGCVQFEPVKKVKEANLIPTAVEDIADLDGDSGAASPAEGEWVDEAGEGESLERFGEVAVEIADSDKAGRGGEARGERGGGSRRGVRIRVGEEEAAHGEVDEGIDEGGEVARKIAAC